MQSVHEPRVLLITSDQVRHRYAATQLAQRLNLVGIVSEAKAPSVIAPLAPSPAEQAVFTQHFAERDEVERRFIGTSATFPDTAVLSLTHGTSNDQTTFEWVQAQRPDLLLLYGSSIIKAPLLEHYDQRIINLHLGLSPYYRGSGTNFWPLVNRQPECVGATIHLAVLRVDAGAVLAQVRPPAERADRAHELGTKTIIAALAAMPQVVAQYLTGQITPQAQRTDIGSVFKQKDFNAAAVEQMWRHLADGMMSEYLAAEPERRLAYPIIELPANF